MALPHEPLKGYLANVEADHSEAVMECESLRAEIERLRADNARLLNNLFEARNHAADLARIIEDVANLRPVRRFDSAPHLSEVARIAQEQSNASLQKYRAEIEQLRAALTRLRDSDWVISLPDRMDAVRDIARAALEGK